MIKRYAFVRCQLLSSYLPQKTFQVVTQTTENRLIWKPGPKGKDGIKSSLNSNWVPNYLANW